MQFIKIYPAIELYYLWYELSYLYIVIIEIKYFLMKIFCLSMEYLNIFVFEHHNMLTVFILHANI